MALFDLSLPELESTRPTSAGLATPPCHRIPRVRTRLAHYVTPDSTKPE
jgi:hypothetical protein